MQDSVLLDKLTDERSCVLGWKEDSSDMVKSRDGTTPITIKSLLRGRMEYAERGV